MIVIITTLMIIACLLLIVVVIIQNPKGGGLSASFGGNATQVFGHQRTTDFIEKLTWGLIIYIAFSSIILNTLYHPPTDDTNQQAPIEQSAQ